MTNKLWIWQSKDMLIYKPKEKPNGVIMPVGSEWIAAVYDGNGGNPIDKVQVSTLDKAKKWVEINVNKHKKKKLKILRK